MSKFSRVGTNIVFYGLGKVYDTAAALIWIGLIARYLGRDGFGEYSIIWAVVTMAVIIPEIGLNNVLIRDASRDREKAPALLKATIQVRRLLALVSILIVIGVVFATTKDPRVRFSACIGSAWIVGRLVMGTNSAIFFAYERVEYDTLLTVFHDTVVLILLYASTKTVWGLAGVIGAISLAACIGGVFSFIVRRAVFCTASKNGDRTLRTYILKESFPIGGSRALRLTGNRIDTLILAWLRTSGEVAVYSGVYGLILRIINVPFLVSRPLFPLLSRLANSPDEKDDFQMVTYESVKLMLILAAPICVGLTVIADKIIPVVFGNGFEEAIAVLRILSWVLLFMFPCALVSFVAVALKRQIYLLKALGICIGLNIILDFILIYYTGYYGACVATLIAEVLFALSLWLLLRRIFPSLHLLKGSLNILLSALVMGVAIHLLKQVNFFPLKPLNLAVLLVIGPAIYLPCLFLFRVFTRDEIRFFRETFLKRRGGEEAPGLEM